MIYIYIYSTCLFRNCIPSKSSWRTKTMSERQERKRIDVQSSPHAQFSYCPYPRHRLSFGIRESFEGLVLPSCLNRSTQLLRRLWCQHLTKWPNPQGSRMIWGLCTLQRPGAWLLSSYVLQIGLNISEARYTPFNYGWWFAYNRMFRTLPWLVWK